MRRNLTLADIEVGKLVPSVLKDLKAWCLARCHEKRCFFGLVDPKARYNQKKKTGEVDTLVPYDEIPRIAEKARQVITEAEEDDQEEVKSAPPPSVKMIQ